MATTAADDMRTVKRGLAPKREVTILQVFLEACGYEIDVDGSFGQATVDALTRFQQDNGLIVDGVAGEKTWTTLFALKPDLLQALKGKWLSQQDIEGFADRYELTVPLVRTVYAVESGGSGFLGLRPVILFEGHVFWDQLKKRGIAPESRQQGNADILFPKWDRKSYVGGLGEYPRLDKARAIDEVAALRSASWGLFQILGYHAESLGYGGAEDFVAKMTDKEAQQLDAFGRFIDTKSFGGKRLIQHLRDLNWEAFAAGYNGGGYKKNGYHLKLQSVHERLTG